MNSEGPQEFAPTEPGPGGDARPSGEAKPVRTKAEVEQWMAEYLAGALHSSPDQIDITVPFEQFALDSVQAVGMTGDLEEWLGCRIDPMVVYDYPTIESLAGYLAEQTERS